MAKLPTLKSQVKPMKPLIGVQVGDKKAWFKQRDKTVAWRKWYNTTRWRQLRWHIIKGALFTCSLCNKIEPDTSKLVCDHIIPHRGEEAKFWDSSNLQCLCKRCHDSDKQRQENRQR